MRGGGFHDPSPLFLPYEEQEREGETGEGKLYLLK